MSRKIEISLEKLTNGTIIDIADELGCKIDCPNIKFNKYLNKIIKDNELIK